MFLNGLIIAAGVCGGLVIVFLLVVSARVFAMRRRLAALMNRNDVDGLRDMAMTSESPTARTAAVEALGRFGAHEVLGPLVEALAQEKEPVVRMLILETITTFDQRAAGPLLRSWTGLAPQEKSGVVRSLKALGEDRLKDALAGVAAEEPELLDVLKAESDEVLQRAVREARASLAMAEADPLHGGGSTPHAGQAPSAEDE